MTDQSLDDVGDDCACPNVAWHAALDETCLWCGWTPKLEREDVADV